MNTYPARWILGGCFPQIVLHGQPILLHEAGNRILTCAESVDLVILNSPCNNSRPCFPDAHISPIDICRGCHNTNHVSWRSR